MRLLEKNITPRKNEALREVRHVGKIYYLGKGILHFGKRIKHLGKNRHF